MSNILYIKRARGIDTDAWFLGSGYYFIDETSNLQWGGDTREEAEEALDLYVCNLEKLS